MSSSQHWTAQRVKDHIHEQYHVSRETCDKLDIYVALLLKWQHSINLISPKTISEVWERHILDCAQLLQYLPPEPSRLLDCGSGAGLPAVILAALTPHQVEMVESDTRKCAFMQTVLREMAVTATIHNERLETLSFRDADIITARAFAPLDRLLDWTKDQHKDGQIFWLQKGRMINEELTKIPNSHTIDQQQFPSLVAGDGVILRLTRQIMAPSL